MKFNEKQDIFGEDSFWITRTGYITDSTRLFEIFGEDTRLENRLSSAIFSNIGFSLGAVISFII